MTITLQAGEVGILLQFTVKDGAGVLSLAGLGADGVKLYVSGQGSRSCTVVDAPNGRADYVTVAGDWPVGRYDWQLAVSYASGRIVKTDRGLLVVEPAVS